MVKNDLCILFPLDLEETTEILLPAAKELKEIGVEEIRLLHVVHPVDAIAVPDSIEQRRKILQNYRKILIDYGIAVVRGEVVIGTPWTKIVERAQSGDIAFVLMGSHGKGFLQRIFLGSQTENVLYRSDSSLFILRLRMQEDRFLLAQEHLFTHILYATDLSEGSRKGIPFLERVAQTSAHLTIAHVEDVRHLEYASRDALKELRTNAKKELNEYKEQFLEKGFKRVDIVQRKGNAISELLHLIEEIQPSLLVMGAKGTYDIAERVLGGVADTLIHRAPVHIMLVR